MTTPTPSLGIAVGREVGNRSILYSLLLTLTNSLTNAPESITVALTTDLITLPTGNLRDGTLIYVASLKDYVQYRVAPTTATVVNNLTVFATKAGGLTRYLRMSIPNLDWQEQLIWFISSAGSDLANGLTQGTAIRTWAEFKRRVGEEYNPLDGTVVNVLDNIPDPLNLDIPERTGATFFLRGVPTDGATGAVMGAQQPDPATNTRASFTNASAVFSTMGIVRLGALANNVYAAVVLASGGGVDGIITQPRDLDTEPPTNAAYPVLTDILTLQFLPIVIPGRITAPPGRVRVQKLQLTESASTGGNQNTLVNLSLEACILNVAGVSGCVLDASTFFRSLTPGVAGVVEGPVTHTASVFQDTRFLNGGNFVSNAFKGVCFLETGSFDIQDANFFGEVTDKLLIHAGCDPVLSVANALYSTGVVQLRPQSIVRNVADGSTMANAGSIEFIDTIADQTTIPPAPADAAFPAAAALTTFVQLNAYGTPGSAINWRTGARFVRTA